MVDFSVTAPALSKGTSHKHAAALDTPVVCTAHDLPGVEWGCRGLKQKLTFHGVKIDLPRCVVFYVVTCTCTEDIN